MDNNHMLALIEQKMVPDDQKVWARHLETTKNDDVMDDKRNEIKDEGHYTIKK